MKHYVTEAWYWIAEDGRLFSSAAGLLVDKADPTFVAWSADGTAATPWPRDEAGQQTDAALQWVFDDRKLAIFVALADWIASLCADIDAQAEAQRGKYITAGSGQAMIYLQKQSQAITALQGLAATPPMTADAGKAAYALLAAEIGITEDPSTKAAAVDVFGVARAVVATVQAWLPVGAAIEAARLKAKAAIGAATTVAAAQAAHDAVAWPSAA